MHRCTHPDDADDVAGGELRLGLGEGEAPDPVLQLLRRLHLELKDTGGGGGEVRVASGGAMDGAGENL